MNLFHKTAAGMGLVCAATILLSQSTVGPVFGYGDFSAEAKVEQQFLIIPDAKLAGQHLKTLTAQPHLSATPEDKATAEYVAQKFRAASLETEIVPYRVLLNRPIEQRVEAYDAGGKLLMSGPTKEHVEGDRFQDNPRVTMPFNGSSASGDVTGEVVYANYGRIEDFDQLVAQHIDLHGKIVMVRYGSNFRGIKVYLAEQRGAIGVLIYCDPQTTATSRATPGRWARGGRRRRCRAARCRIFHATRAIRRHRVWHRLRNCLTVRGCRRQNRQPADHPVDSAELPRCGSDFEGAHRHWRTTGLAGSASVSLPPWRFGGRRGVGSPCVEAGLSLRTIWDVIGKVKGTEYPASGWWQGITGMRGSTELWTHRAARRRCWRRCMALAGC